MTKGDIQNWEEQLEHFADDKIQNVEARIMEHLDSEGRVWTHDLVTNKLEYQEGYKKSSFEKLVKLIGMKLKEEGKINFEYEDGPGAAQRKVWVKN